MIKPFSARELIARVSTQLEVRQFEVQTRKRLEALAADAAAASRAKDEFVAMLGHELRNPLSPILTALQLSPDNSKLCRKPEGIRGACQRRRTFVSRDGGVTTPLTDPGDARNEASWYELARARDHRAAGRPRDAPGR